MKKIFISSDHAGYNLKEEVKKKFIKKYRFQDLGTGGESAYGSRARLGAQDRMEECSRGLTKELAGLRQAGYQDSLQRVQDQINTRRNLFGDCRNLAGDTQR